MNKIITLIVGVIFISGVGGLVYWQKHEAAEEQAALQAAQEAQKELGSNLGGTFSDDDDEDDDTRSSGTVTGGIPSGGGTQSITMTEIMTHAARTSCWSAINGSVYDLTSWIPRHPGGEQTILSVCGIDGSEKFNGQHGGVALQQQILAGFKIGVLAK